MGLKGNHLPLLPAQSDLRRVSFPSWNATLGEPDSASIFKELLGVTVTTRFQTFELFEMELLRITKTGRPPPIPSPRKHLCGSPGAGRGHTSLFPLPGSLPFSSLQPAGWKNGLQRKQQMFACLAGHTSGCLDGSRTIVSGI